MDGDATLYQLSVPGFVAITDVSPDGATEPEFVISNEATGKHFKANRATVQFLDAVKRTGSLEAAAREAGLASAHVQAVMKQLLGAGVVTQAGKTVQAPAPKAPLEGKLISMRGDLIDASALTRRLEPLGRVLFSPIGYAAWLVAMIATVTQLIENRDKVAFSLRQLPEQGLQSLLLLALLYGGVKALHEMGHALAYRRFCLRAGFDPGPIRMGIAIFAMTPFPFTDVTSAWRLRSRFERVMIGAGGMYVETWVIAILTTIWAQVQAGPAQSLILQVAVISGALTLAFNLNPAVKLDGYYMLTDAIRRPNLARRGSFAARSWLARRLGADVPAPDGFDLGYWTLAYLYRWTIFAGIFWLAYRIDPTLAYVVLGVTLMMLIVRPALATVRFLKTQGLRSGRVVAVSAVIGVIAASAFIPFSDRLLVPAHYLAHETRFVETTDTGRLSIRPGALRLENPQLQEDLVTLRLRREALENAVRASSNGATQQARLLGDVDRLAALETELAERVERLETALPETAVWTPLSAEMLDGAWVLSADAPLGALSEPVDPILRLRVPQALLQRDLALQAGLRLQARAQHDPTCLVEAVLVTPLAEATILADSALLHARPVAAPCLETLASGTAFVVRIPAPNKTLAARLVTLASRLLQDRLPVNVTSVN